jgi:hypothetical protein
MSSKEGIEIWGMQLEVPARVTYNLTEFGTGLFRMFWPIITLSTLYFSDT